MKTTRLYVSVLSILMVLLLFSQGAIASDYETHWSAYYIHSAKTRGWLTADAAGNFSPDRDATSGEFAMMLWNALDKPEPKGICLFPDVSNTEPYYKAVTALNERGVVVGSNGLFHPEETIVRERAFTMVYRALNIPSTNKELHKTFIDAADISEWSCISISALLENGMIRGTDQNAIAPQGKLTIAEMTALLVEVYDKVNAKNEPRIVKIDSSFNQFIALDAAGKVYVWGTDSYNLAEIPKNLPKIIDIGIGSGHAVALDENGKLHGWGSELDILGINYSKALPPFVSVSAGGRCTAALTADGKVHLFGSYYDGEKTPIPEYLPTIIDIIAGDSYTIAVSKKGELFDLGSTNENSPPPVKPVSYAPLSYKFASLGSDGVIYSGVTHANLLSYFIPQPDIPGIHSIFGYEHSMAAIDKAGKVYIWGEYQKESIRPILQPPENLPPISQVALSYQSIACLGIDGKVYYWATHKLAIPVPEEIDGFLEEWPTFAPFTWPEVKAAANVRTFDDLLDEIRNGTGEITITQDFKINREFQIGQNTKIIIPKGIRITVEGCFLYIWNQDLENNGTILIQNGGIFYGQNTEDLGQVQIVEDGRVVKHIYEVTINDLSRLFGAASVITEINVDTVEGENPTITFDRDFTIPAGKVLNTVFHTIKVNKGVTLTIDGDITTYTTPIIEGTVIGKITIYDLSSY